MTKLLKSLATPVLFTAVLILAAPAAFALGQGDWLARGRLINLSPNDSTGEVSSIAGTEAGVDDDTTLELDFTYMVTNNLGLELILGTTKHQVSGIKGAVAGADIGTVRLLPPTLTLQYHFQPGSNIRPYAGLGINYTHFYSQKAGPGLGAGASVDYDDSWGLAAQAGVDIDINKQWFFNFDVKYVQVDTTLTITGGAVPGTTTVTLGPWVFGIGIGTRF